MDNRSEVEEFLTCRWPQMTSWQAGLPVSGGHRRSAGPRRDEGTLLAAAGYGTPRTGHLSTKGMR